MNAFRRLLLALGMAITATSAFAQGTTPGKPIEMIVPWGPGGGADVLGRIVARWLEADLKASVPVTNSPGASGMIGLSRLLQLPADGHAIGVLTGDSLMMAATPTSTFKISQAKTIAVLVRQPSGLFVASTGKYKSWQDVVKAIQSKPGSVTVAITGPNTADDLTVRYLASRGLTLVGVPYTKPGERYTAVIGGHVDLLYEQAGDVRGFLDSGQLRPLIFFAEHRLAAPFTDVPVSRELGYDILLPQVRALLVRADTDPQQLQALNRSLERFAGSEEYRRFLEQQMALPDSFMPAAKAHPFILGELEASRKLLATYSQN